MGKRLLAKSLVLAALCTLVLAFFEGLAFAGSVYTPRDSGTEPPGGPRAPIALPQTGSFGRTAEGGMGYTDAYGNTISQTPKESAPRKRLPKGAFGRSFDDTYDRPLPDPAPRPSKPAWSF